MRSINASIIFLIKHGGCYKHIMGIVFIVLKPQKYKVEADSAVTVKRILVAQLRCALEIYTYALAIQGARVGTCKMFFFYIF